MVTGRIGCFATFHDRLNRKPKLTADNLRNRCYNRATQEVNSNATRSTCLSPGLGGSKPHPSPSWLVCPLSLCGSAAPFADCSCGGLRSRCGWLQ